MPKAIAFIPHARRLKAHKVDYVKAIASAMDSPYQSEDGRDLSEIQQKLYNKCAELSGIPYWTFTDCCTDALQIAIHTLTKPGDLIVVPAYGWRAFANAVSFMNRKLQFVDIDDTGNIDIDKLHNIPSETKAIIVVHNFGTVVDVTKIKSIVDSSIKIIEDAAPAFYMGEPYSYIPGSAADAMCVSFDFTKYPGTLGSGGAIAVRDAEIAERIYECSAHGRSRSGEIVTIGTKSYMDNTSCAVLLKEIELFEQLEYRKRRVEIATWYNDKLPYKSVPGENYIYERYTMSVPFEEVETVIQKLNSVRCLAKTFFKEPLHKYSWLGGVSSDFILKTDEFVSTTVMLPAHHYLENEELERIANVLS